MSEVTRILTQIESGDPSAAEQLLPLVYDELRKLAQEKPCQGTELLHEDANAPIISRCISLETPRHPVF